MVRAAPKRWKLWGIFFFFKRRVNISLQNEFYESLIVPIILFCKNNDINLIYGRYQISFFIRLAMSYAGEVWESWRLQHKKLSACVWWSTISLQFRVCFCIFLILSDIYISFYMAEPRKLVSISGYYRWTVGMEDAKYVLSLFRPTAVWGAGLDSFVPEFWMCRPEFNTCSS